MVLASRDACKVGRARSYVRLPVSVVAPSQEGSALTQGQAVLASGRKADCIVPPGQEVPGLSGGAPPPDWRALASDVDHPGDVGTGSGYVGCHSRIRALG